MFIGYSDVVFSVSLTAFPLSECDRKQSATAKRPEPRLIYAEMRFFMQLC